MPLPDGRRQRRRSRPRVPEAAGHRRRAAGTCRCRRRSRPQIGFDGDRPPARRRPPRSVGVPTVGERRSPRTSTSTSDRCSTGAAAARPRLGRQAAEQPLNRHRRARPAVSPAAATCAHGPAVAAAPSAPRRCAPRSASRDRAVRARRRSTTRAAPALVPTAGAPTIAFSVASAGPLDVERGRRGDRQRTVAERSKLVLHQIRAEVREQQQSAEQEERDDQDRRNEADEDVRDDQLAADAPQQPLLSRTSARAPRKYDAAADQRDRRQRVERRRAPSAPATTRPSAMTAIFTAAPITIARPGQRSEQRVLHRSGAWTSRY